MFKRIWYWILVNAILPIVIPALFLASINWLLDGSFPIRDLFSKLINDGFYIFSALTLMFSLYEDYDALKECVKPIMQTWLVLMAIATLAMFYQIQTRDNSYIDNHQFQFYLIWILTAISSIIVKYKILKRKQRLAI